ncbi:MAG: hypothetical protein HFI17_16080 [Lachnospiraceae bacterium]|jgi:hypothetical protein|nr:hypothetical protein [Lachnospiraceae bacterium]MCI9601996.1 hypothetical protein [Lachnospiraceae bacterium]
MEMNSAMRLFIRNEIASESAKWIYKAMTVLQAENKNKTINHLLDELEAEISDVRVCYIQISLLRYRILQKRPFYQLQIFGPEFYLAPPLAEKELQWNWMYEPYYEFCEKITASSRKYVMQITDADLSRLCLLELEETKEIVRRMFQESLADLLTRETFQRAASQREISIQLSDYMGEYEPLLVLNHQTNETGEWLNGIL